MNNTQETLIWLTIFLLVLWAAWMILYGFRRGSLAIVLRCMWIAPLVMALFPQIKNVAIPNSVSLKPIHVLLDDSLSMKDDRRWNDALAKVELLKQECRRFGCTLKVTELSQLSPLVEQGYTPLAQSFHNWVYGTGGEPWVLISDGGDYRPAQAWNSRLKGIGTSEGESRGMILAYPDREQQNIWVETNDAVMFSFENKPTMIHAAVGRELTDGQLSVQLQVFSGEQHLASNNVLFRDNESRLDIEIPVSSLARGQHLISMKAVPLADEVSIWDNTVHANLEVMPNTIGLLHLLGSPSWDGRFLRRYLKSEPKYDLISFFILRDPVDLQLTNERELSLIPFPVERLFNQELNNFRSVIIQNFALYQFLEPSYQRNLVEFVKNGGGLLFIGGPRALHASDYSESPLSSILPFQPKGGSQASSAMDILRRFNTQVDETGPYYEADLSYEVTLAEPTAEQRALANVFDDWRQMAPSLAGQKNLKGLHHMENVEFKDGEYTPLLNAKLANGQEVPLAVASYPGKGRALWIFSDSFWRMALNPNSESSRESYQSFMNSAITWLLRQELRKPLVMRELNLRPAANHTLFDVVVSGPAARYLNDGGQWFYEVCGLAIKNDDLIKERQSSDMWLLSGRLETVLPGGRRCPAAIRGDHPAFGSVTASIGAVVPEIFQDENMPGSFLKLTQLSRLSEAELYMADDKQLLTSIQSWLQVTTGRLGLAQQTENRTLRDYYWVLDRWWFWLLVFALPLEVIVRRWPQLTAMRWRNNSQQLDSGH
ncbi:MAG: hypothetical protein ACOH5I_22975 [Oligoflexus sp.]